MFFFVFQKQESGSKKLIQEVVEEFLKPKLQDGSNNENFYLRARTF